MHLLMSAAVPKHSKDLQNAVHDDLRRRELDSAKKRAAAQNADYESFAALVSMAHVKPFERRKVQQEESARHVHSLPAWSFDATGSRAPTEDVQNRFTNVRDLRKNTQVSSNVMELAGKNVVSHREELAALATRMASLDCLEPKCMTSDAFKREWRRAGSSLEHKLKLLLCLLPDQLPIIFKVELPPSILVDMINVLCWWRRSSANARAGNLSSLDMDEEKQMKSENVDDSITCKSTFEKPFDRQLAFRVLESLPKCGRFALSIKLAGGAALSEARQLINGLMQHTRSKEVGNEAAGDSLASLCYAEPKSESSFDAVEEVSELSKEDMSLDKLKKLACDFSCM